MVQKIQMVISMIEHDLDRDLPLEELAQRVNLSYSRLRHVFKAETGMTPARYRKALRMQKAKELVEETFLSMKEIMTSVGIKDKNQFARDFRRAYGLTPSEYRTHRVNHLKAKAAVKSTAK